MSKVSKQDVVNVLIDHHCRTATVWSDERAWWVGEVRCAACGLLTDEDSELDHQADQIITLLREGK